MSRVTTAIVMILICVRACAPTCFYKPGSADTFREAWITRMARTWRGVSDTDTRGVSTASRHHQDRSLPLSLPPPRPRTSLGRTTSTYSFFLGTIDSDHSHCTGRGAWSVGLRRLQILLSTKAALNPAWCYGTLPAVAAVGGEDPWVNIVRTLRQARNEYLPGRG
jgi:hypothetical protein